MSPNTQFPTEILRQIIALSFTYANRSPTGNLSNALQLTSQAFRAITLEIVWATVELDDPTDCLSRVLVKDHIRDVVQAVLVRNMYKPWSTTSWRNLMSLLKSFPKLSHLFFEQEGTGIYPADHLRDMIPVPVDTDSEQRRWDVVTFCETQRPNTTHSYLVPWSVLDDIFRSCIITQVQCLEISSNHGALETDLIVYCVFHGIILNRLDTLAFGGFTDRHFSSEIFWKFITLHTPSIHLLRVSTRPSPTRLPTFVDSWPKCSWPPALRHLQFPFDFKNGDWPPHLVSYANLSPRKQPSHRAEILCQQMRFQDLQELSWTVVDAYEMIALLDALSYESPNILRIKLNHTLQNLDISSVGVLPKLVSIVEI
jgi:hypothetical protein